MKYFLIFASTVVLGSGPVYADPVRLIGGSIHACCGGDAIFTLSSLEFSAAGIAHGDMGFHYSGQILEPGAPANLSGGVGFHAGFPTDAHSNLMYSGAFLFRAPASAFPCETGPFGQICTTTAPFTFTGTFAARDSVSGQQLFEHQLIGRGIARGDNFNGAQSVTYVFDAAPVPEPGTMLLVGFGAFALAALRRRPDTQTRSQRRNVVAASDPIDSGDGP